MRHRSGLRKLNRTSAHRLAMLRNMMNSLLEHEAIKTTVPKAKELRRVVEPMITLAKVDTVANRRLAFNRLRNRAIVTKCSARALPTATAATPAFSRWATALVTMLPWLTWSLPNVLKPSKKSRKKRPLNNRLTA